MESNISATIRKARRERGLTLQQVADRIGVSYPAVQQWEAGRTRPSTENLLKLQAVLDADLLGGRVHNVRFDRRSSATFPETVGADDNLAQGAAGTPSVAAPPEANVVMEGPAQERWAPRVRDIEELGLMVASVESPDSAFEFNGQVIDRVVRPPGLVDRKGVFALRVANHSMWPKFRDGERVYVDQKRPAIEDFVVIELHPAEEGRPGKAYIKMLVGRDARKIRVQQFNPEGFLEFGHDEIKRTFRVIPTEELWGG